MSGPLARTTAHRWPGSTEWLAPNRSAAQWLSAPEAGLHFISSSDHVPEPEALMAVGAP